MTQFTDRRTIYTHKNIVNRQRFIQRFKKQIKLAVQESVSKRSIKEIDRGEKISLPTYETNEVHFTQGPGGLTENVLPGNKNFVKGDRIPRPPILRTLPQSRASKEGQDYDHFSFSLTREEFLHLFFEELKLPQLVQKELAEISGSKYHRAGFAKQGSPTNMNITRSMRNATARRIALASAYQQQINKLREQADMMQQEDSNAPGANEWDQHAIGRSDQANKIVELTKKIKNIPYLDESDIRYNRFEQIPQPSTQAVMFCLMDVSGSMDETKKDMAKRFFILLYLFLIRKYESIEVIFIRHHTIAKEVEEQEFFYSRETGGTVVSSALELMSELIDTRYSPQAWNIYAAQASDGDNWNADSPHCQMLLTSKIMPQLQYFAYVEIMPRQHQSLWHAYQTVQSQYDHFAMKKITHVDEIYSVLANLFQQELTHEID